MQRHLHPAVLALPAIIALLAGLWGSAREAPLTSDASAGAQPGPSPQCLGVFPPPAGEAVDCKMDSVVDGRGLLLLSSCGLDDDNIKYAFRELVLQLPDAAWAADGATKKAAAAQRNGSAMVDGDHYEPELYEGLDVLVLEDPCFLKTAMWDKNNNNFNDHDGINYKKVGYVTDPALLRPFLSNTEGPLDGGMCADWGSKRGGGLGGFGFEASRIRHYSIFDHLASDSLKIAVLRLDTEGTPLSLASLNLQADTRGEAFAKARALLLSASIIIINGGNPDFAMWVFTHFAPTFGDLLRARVKEGSSVFVGRSAGSMLASSDIGLSCEAAPALLKHLLKNSTRGLGLVGNCAVRPHYTDKWQLASLAYERLKSVNLVRVPNSEALKCIGVDCRMTGNTSAQAPTPVQAPSSNFERLTLSFEATTGS